MGDARTAFRFKLPLSNHPEMLENQYHEFPFTDYKAGIPLSRADNKPELTYSIVSIRCRL